MRSVASRRMTKKRVHLLSTVNAANVSKTGGTYTIRDVCGAVDGIVMNRKLYPADQLTAGAPSLEGKPAPAGHPKNKAGQHISALNGEALASAWIGSYVQNARHVGGRTLADIVVNEQQAKAHPLGAKLVERLDAAIAGTNAEPIHVSTGLYHDAIAANGESNGKKYDQIAINIRYDHLAILVDGVGAGTPADGVGMFLNSAGEQEEVEVVEVNSDPEDKRSAGLVGWLKRLIVGNAGDVSFDQISSGLHATLPDGAWVQEVFDRYAIWRDRDSRLLRQDYTVSSDGSVAWTGTAQEVRREVTYEPVTNHAEDDQVKDKILAALNSAGINVAGKTDDQLLQDYDAIRTATLQAQLTAANSKIAGFEMAANAAAEAELTALATSLATNSSLTPADFKAMGIARCRELKATAAPVVVGNASTAANARDEFADYDLNKLEAA